LKAIATVRLNGLAMIAANVSFTALLLLLLLLVKNCITASMKADSLTTVQQDGGVFLAFLALNPQAFLQMFESMILALLLAYLVRCKLVGLVSRSRISPLILTG
jgi:predicted membrane-bound dolichyl-phosphate-mannose-protein mannosyltransferase